MNIYIFDFIGHALQIMSKKCVTTTIIKGICTVLKICNVPASTHSDTQYCKMRHISIYLYSSVSRMNDSDWFLDRMNRYRPSGPVPLPSLGELKVGQHEIHNFSDIEFFKVVQFFNFNFKFQAKFVL
jgi:hypothetical protein